MANDDNEIESYFDKIIKEFSKLDGSELEPEFTKDLELAEDGRGAYLDMLSDKLINEGKIEEAPEEYNIEKDDIISNAIQTKINRILQG